jgi:hypothetical protein
VHSGGSAKGSTTAGNSANLSFVGTGVTFVLYTDQWAGIAAIKVDGVNKGEVDTYSTPAKAQVQAYTVSGLTNGAHTVTITPTGRRNPSSGGNWIWLDAFDVLGTSAGPTTPPDSGTPAPTPPPTTGTFRIEQTSPAVKWNRSWSINKNPIHSGGSARLSMISGARASFTFTGTAVRWIAYKDQWSGMANVYVDGALKASVDLYGAPAAAQSVAYSVAGLPNGPHTIVVEATATKRAASGGTWVWVDAFEYVGESLSAPALQSSSSTTSAATSAGGGSRLASTSAGTPLRVGSASIDAGSGGRAPSGVAIFGYRSNGVLVTEAGVPASVSLLRGRLFAETSEGLKTGLAIANPNDAPATVSFVFTENTGATSAAGSLTIPPKGQIARFLDETPFGIPPAATGSFTFTSSVPVSAAALRGRTNSRSEFLITTLPIADLDVPNPATIFFPHVADGGGWTTRFALINPSDSVIAGKIKYLGQVVAYSIPPRGQYSIATSGAAPTVQTGAAEVTPDPDNLVPTGLAIFSFTNQGVVVTEAGVPATSVGNAFRMYAALDGAMRTGVAIQNNNESAAVLNFELSNLDGTPAGVAGSIEIPAFGQRALFLNEIPGFESLQGPFSGVLRISSGNEAALSILGLRARVNERGDFLVTTTPATDENAEGAQHVMFPHFATGDGYTTEFITFSGAPAEPAAGSLQLFSQGGEPLRLE